MMVKVGVLNSRALNRTSTQLELSSACMNLIKQKAKSATNNRK